LRSAWRRAVASRPPRSHPASAGAGSGQWRFRCRNRVAAAAAGATAEPRRAHAPPRAAAGTQPPSPRRRPAGPAAVQRTVQLIKATRQGYLMSTETAQDRALLHLARELRTRGYHFITPTPLTHQRVNQRPENALAVDLPGVFGWSRPFQHELLPPLLF